MSEFNYTNPTNAAIDKGVTGATGPTGPLNDNIPPAPTDPGFYILQVGASGASGPVWISHP